MWLYNQTSTTARTALIYITVGALTVIWAGVWCVALYNNPPETPTVYYWCFGLIATGLTLVLLGVTVGRMGQPAEVAALPPEGVPVAVVASQPMATAASPVLIAPSPNGVLVAPDGEVVGAPPMGR